MSRRVWTKPFVKTVLSGDQRKARSLERKARSYIGYLFDQMGDRQKHRAGNWNLKDGSKITAFAWKDALGKRALVRIFYPETNNEVELIFALGGLFEARNLHPQLEGIFEDVSLVKRKKKGVYERTPFKPSSKLVESLCETNIPCGYVSGDWYEKPRNAYAGFYSGEMRKVVQYLLGTGSEVLYSYCSSRTHGIWTSSDGVKYVIEIDDSNGVTSWPLSVRDPTSEEKEIGIEYAPSVISALPSVGSRKKLLDAAFLSDWLDLTPLFNECGWAFSYDGSEAMNIGYTSVSDELDRISHYVTSIYKITITEDPILKSPLSASISLVESGNLGNSYDSFYNIKFPRYAGLDGAKLTGLILSFSTQIDDIDFSSAPVYCFYNTSNQPIIVRHKVLPSIITEIDTRVSGDPAGCFYGNDIYTPIALFNISQEYSYSWKFELAYFDVENMSNPFTQVQAEQLTKKTLSSSESNIGNFVTAYGNDSSGVIASEHVRLDETYILEQKSIVVQYNSLIIPFFEREAFYIGHQESDLGYNHSTTTVTAYSTYAKGATYPQYPYSHAYCIDLPESTFPCACNGTGDSGFLLIGVWSTSGTPTGTLDPPTQTGGGGSAGIPLNYYGKDENMSNPDRWLYCYDYEGTYGATGSCESRKEYSSEVITENPNTGKQIYFFSSHLSAPELIVDGEYDVYDTFFYSITNIPADVWIDASLDVFTGAGSISKKLDGLGLPDRYVFKNADTYYPLDEMNLRQHGWFGYPFPELMN